MDIQTCYEIFDYEGNRWKCSIYRNESYKDSPSFIRLQCRDLGFDKILDSLNNEFTLIKILKFITTYHYSKTATHNSIDMKADTLISIDEDPI